MKTATIETINSPLEWYGLGNHRGQKLAYIKRLCRRIAEAFHPERIILFGSQAYGQPTADPDVDLLVRSPEEVRERLELGDRFIHEIIERGKVMDEADHARMDHQS